MCKPPFNEKSAPVENPDSSEAIHAEIIARQRIALNLVNLRASFETAKSVAKPKTSFK
jgi:hypothetical protein